MVAYDQAAIFYLLFFLVNLSLNQSTINPSESQMSPRNNNPPRNGKLMHATTRKAPNKRFCLADRSPCLARNLPAWLDTAASPMKKNTKGRTNRTMATGIPMTETTNKDSTANKIRLVSPPTMRSLRGLRVMVRSKGCNFSFSNHPAIAERIKKSRLNASLASHRATTRISASKKPNLMPWPKQRT